MLLGLGFLALGARLYVLQVVRHEKYRNIVDNNTQRVFFREPRRGDILDVNGNLLATSLPVKKVCADRNFIGPYGAEVASVLAPLIDWKEVELAQRLRPVLYTNAAGQLKTNAYVNLHRKVSAERWEQITQAMRQLSSSLRPARLTLAEKIFFSNFRQKAVYAEDDQHRVYLCKHLASHVLGYAQDREIELQDSTVSELIGMDGIESWFNGKLTGVRGWKVTEVDSRKREIAVYREQDVEPRPGLNVVLTLDMVIQNIVETELDEAMKQHAPISATCIVVRPRTGEILAMATLPDYDPNRPGDVSEDHRRKRMISDLVEPGSTFKIVVVSAALNEKIVKLTDIFDCENGRFFYLGRPLKDHGHHGLLSVMGIITKSSNIGAAKIGLKLGEDKLYQYIRAFGFGTNSGITLGGEVKGIVHAPKTKGWDKLMITRIPMGQSIAVTPLQMVMAMSTLANEGRLMRPMLVKGLRDQNGEIVTEYHPQMVRQVVRPDADRQIVEALKTVPTKEGTARRAALDHYTVAGKTGTAQKPCPGGYLEGEYICSFIGFFPADTPEVCIFVGLDNPQGAYLGGEVAAPIFKRIGEQVAQYLKIRPDREPEAPEKIVAHTNRLNTVAARSPERIFR